MVSDELHAMLANDERHWWYRGRRRVLRAELDRVGLPPEARVLDAGCGSGRTLDELERYGDVSGLDLSAEAVAVARERHVDVRQGAVEAIPFDDATFDLVTCLDVLEHTPDDRRTLAELRRVTRPGGHLLLTVPAYQWLWSGHDVANGHERRYRRRTLRAAARESGWTLDRDTYFNGLLLAPAVAVRLAQRYTGLGRGRSNLELTPSRLNGVLELPLRLEAALLARGARLPAGLSVLAVYRNAPVTAAAAAAPTAAPTRAPHRFAAPRHPGGAARRPGGLPAAPRASSRRGRSAPGTG
jgi:SAM-dependent methyltransferase